MDAFSFCESPSTRHTRDIYEEFCLSEQPTFKAFHANFYALDKNNLIENLVWSELSGRIRVLLGNPHVFQSFWDNRNG